MNVFSHLVVHSVLCCQAVQADLEYYLLNHLEVHLDQDYQVDRQLHVLPSDQEHHCVHQNLAAEQKQKKSSVGDVVKYKINGRRWTCMF